LAVNVFIVHQLKKKNCSNIAPVLLWSQRVVNCYIEDGCVSSGHGLDFTHTLAEFTDEEGSQRGLLVVVLDVHVDDVHRLEGLLLARVQV